jgi:cytoskeletal protein RodZ
LCERKRGKGGPTPTELQHSEDLPLNERTRDTLDTMGGIDETAVSQTDTFSDKPRRRGCLGHCARFWWAYLLAVVVIVAVVVPCVILVAIPKMAQQKVDDAQMTVDSIIISNTQAKDMTMSINSTITTDGSVHATIDGFQGVMYLEDYEPHTPFATISFPQTTADALQTVNVSQVLPITDQVALTRFNTWLLANESLRVTVFGDTNVHVSGISRAYPITFKKTLTIPGLNKLAGTVVNETATSLLVMDALGNNFNGTAYIPNRSPVTFELGNVTFHNYLFGKDIGTVYFDNLTLRSGMNVHFMRATISVADVGTALAQPQYCQGPDMGILPFQLSGKSVVNHDQALPYFADALAAVNQSLNINVGETLKHSQNMTIPCAGK